ncbi:MULTISPECIES: DUF2249 domain-containing protein [Haloferax]|uniref:DUF2249 domain-containing protein n=1 Tax=Haloferax denitrificans ATCC 35960 TaxID=662478 RepID=M0JI65_9EURY|nr:DUF2249 domain-containing protein [Haloferax denitrificans]EMA08028.1 hypothetical protein C438_02877 [Haloferax denitrificans ATCC 35960]
MGSFETTGETQRLDVRDIDGEPFGHIMSAIGELSAGDSLLLVNSFEPVPLYDVLKRRGCEFQTTQVEDDEWHITISLK